MFLRQRIDRWLEAKIISKEVADKIIQYESEKSVRLRLFFTASTGVILTTAATSWIMFRKLWAQLGALEPGTLHFFDLLSLFLLAAYLLILLLNWFRKTKAYPPIAYICFTIGTLVIGEHIYSNHLSPYHSFVTWAALVGFSVLAGLGKFRLLIVVSILTYILTGLFLNEVSGFFDPVTLRALAVAILPILLIVEARKALKKDKKGSIKKDTVLAKWMALGLSYLTKYSNFLSALIGPRRGFLIIFFGLLWVVGVYRENFPILNKVSPSFFETVPKIGLVLVFISLTLIELPRFSGVFSAIAWLQIVILATRYENQEFTMSLGYTNFEEGRLALITFSVVILGLLIKRVIKKKIPIFEAFNLGPLGLVSLVALLSVV